MTPPQPGFGLAERNNALAIFRVAFEEDHARDDITSSLTVPRDLTARADLVARESGVLAGLPCAAIGVEVLGASISVDSLAREGDRLEPGQVVARLSGSLRDILALERSVLNLMGSLSGCATLVARYVEAAGKSCRILDTRKTIPGLRILQKYAVRCGGGMNHRPHLAGGFLLKDNHRWGGLNLMDAVAEARRNHPALPVVIEVDSGEQLEKALPLRPDRILLDNFHADRIREARARRDAVAPGVGLEASGGVNLETVGPLASAGADYISVGALTHSAAVFDLGLDLQVDSTRSPARD